MWNTPGPLHMTNKPHLNKVSLCYMRSMESDTNTGKVT